MMQTSQEMSILMAVGKSIKSLWHTASCTLSVALLTLVDFVLGDRPSMPLSAL